MGRRLISLATRLSLIVLLLAASGVGGAWLLYRYQRSEYEAFLEQENERLRERAEILEQMVARLSRSRRLAQIVVTNQQTLNSGEPGRESASSRASQPGEPTPSFSFEDESARMETSLLIVELDENEEPLRRWHLTIPGRVAFFDGLVVKFDFESVAEGHPLRGQSIALLRRVYSEYMSPQNGYLLDQPGDIPAGYRLEEVAQARDTEPHDSDTLHEFDQAAFERSIWQRFWEIATTPELADAYGVRVAQGEAVYKPMVPGVLYELSLDAVGGLNLETKPLPEAVSEVLSAAQSAMP